MQDNKHVILAVDDDQDVLDALRMVLEANGYVMAEAYSAEAGLKAFKQVHPDLLIVDLMMEEVDAGTSFVKELRALGTPPPSTCSAPWATTSTPTSIIPPWASAASSRNPSTPTFSSPSSARS